MKIKGTTNVVGLIGHPVEHSFSPPMHNAAFEELGLDYVYVPFDVEGQNLENAIRGADSLNIKGFNVTIPHKIEVMDYLNEIDETAKLIGAVNTIDFKTLKGYNTDGIGAIRAINEVTDIKDKKVILAGAGGASRAIAFYLARENPEEIVILNRNTKRSDNLAADVLDSKLSDNVKSDSIEKIGDYLKDGDILIDSTPLGMYPHIDDAPIATADMMHEDLVVNDIVYNPNQTVLLKEAIEANAKPVYGIKMLLYQGAESFKIWTGHDAPIDVMENALKETLNMK